jgi:phage shock protein A
MTGRCTAGILLLMLFANRRRALELRIEALEAPVQRFERALAGAPGSKREIEQRSERERYAAGGRARARSALRNWDGTFLPSQ